MVVFVSRPFKSIENVKMSTNHDYLVKMVDKMPTFPKSAHRIIELTSDINCTPRDVISVIEFDPILTIKILKMVNSSYFGLSKEVTSIKHAVVYVGLNTVKNVALSVATIGALPKTNRPRFDMDAFWWHVLTTGTIAKLLAAKMGESESDQANYFVAGLLHDIGKIVFAQFLPAEFAQVMAISQQRNIPIHLSEKKLIGADHTEIGAMLGEKWQLPKQLVACIKEHHNTDENAHKSAMEKGVFAANQVSYRVQAEAAGTEMPDGEFPPHIEAWLKMPVSEVVPALTGLADEIEKAKVFMALG